MVNAKGRPAAADRTAPRMVEPRLLDLKAAAAYSGITYWTLRSLVAEGRIPAVRLPSPGAADGRPLRRVLLDRGDLDRFIEQCKERGSW